LNIDGLTQQAYINNISAIVFCQYLLGYWYGEKDGFLNFKKYQP